MVTCLRLSRRSSEATVRTAVATARHTSDVSMWSSQATYMTETSARDTGMILECCGCERIYFRRDYWFSAWETIGTDPISGGPRLEGGVETVYWPAPVRRRRPNWLEKIEVSERDLGVLLDEMYTALDNDLRVLAAIAARTVFDRASQLLGVDPAIGFKEKLDSLGADGKIGVHEEEILQVLVDAGSAAAHRGWPSESR